MKAQGTRIAGYVRVSTEEQVDGHSLDAQRHQIERYAEQHSLTLVGIYADEGVSAHSDRIAKRPRLAALLDDAEHGAFDTVVVHTLDRWSRNIRVQGEALHRLGQAGVGFVSITENFDFSTPSGKMMLTMMGGVSEFFSDQLGVHVSKAFRQRAELGFPVGPVPFGYRSASAREVPTIVPEEADAVRGAFTARAAGQSNGQIAEALNRDGFRTRNGHLFTAYAMRDMFTCRFYTGVIVYRESVFAGRHEPLIAEDLYARVQTRHVQRGPHRAAVQRPRGLVAGILRCARCGHGLHAERGHLGRPMYRERHSHECPTNHRSLMAYLVDRQLGDIFRSLELESDWHARIASRAGNIDGPTVEELRGRRGRLSRAYAEGGFTLAEYEARLAALDAEIRHALGTVPVEMAEVGALLRDLPALWDEATPDEQRRLLAPLVERVYLDVESKRIAGLVPAPAFRVLMESAMHRTADCAAVLVAPSDLLPGAGNLGVGGDGGELNSPSSEPSSRICYGRSQWLISPVALH